MELQKIAKIRAMRLLQETDEITPDEMKEIAASVKRKPKSFIDAINGDGLSFIIEVKKVSDSGSVKLKLYEPVEIVKELQTQDIAAFSVVTEKDCYKGAAGHLRAARRITELPILRRDYIIEAYQIYESYVIGADAVLLIAELHDTETLRKFINLAASLGMESVVEAHNCKEIRSATDAGASIINVYDRSVWESDDAQKRIQEILEIADGHAKIILEGGISNPDNVKLANDAGVSAIILGDYLMQSDDYRRTFKWLKSKIE